MTFKEDIRKLQNRNREDIRRMTNDQRNFAKEFQNECDKQTKANTFAVADIQKGIKEKKKEFNKDVVEIRDRIKKFIG